MSLRIISGERNAAECCDSFAASLLPFCLYEIAAKSPCGNNRKKSASNIPIGSAHEILIRNRSLENEARSKMMRPVRTRWIYGGMKNPRMLRGL